MWMNIWKAKIHARLKLFLWRVFVNVIPTRELMVRRTGNGYLHCPICGAEVESLFHLFRECQGIKAIAFAGSWVLKWTDGLSTTFSKMLAFCLNPSIGIEGDKDERWNVVFFSSLLYYSWFYINMVVHDGKVELSKVVIMFNQMAEEGLGEAAATLSLEGNVEMANTASWCPS